MLEENSTKVRFASETLSQMFSNIGAITSILKELESQLICSNVLNEPTLFAESSTQIYTDTTKTGAADRYFVSK